MRRWRTHVRDEPESFYFAVSILRALKSSAAVLAFAELAADVERDLRSRIEDGAKLAEAINLALSFKGAPVVYAHTAEKLREFLHATLRLKLSKAQRATAVWRLAARATRVPLTSSAPCPSSSSPGAVWNRQRLRPFASDFDGHQSGCMMLFRYPKPAGVCMFLISHRHTAIRRSNRCAHSCSPPRAIGGGWQ